MNGRRVRWAPIWLAGMLVFLYAPLARVVVNSFNVNSVGTSFDGATLAWYRQAWTDPTVRDSTVVSLWLAAAAAFISTALALAAVLATRSRSSRPRLVFRTLTSARVLLPEVLIAAGIAILLPLLGIPLGAVALVIGHAVFLTAFAIVLIEARAAGLDRRVEDAAADLGASRGRVTRTVIIPDLWPGIAAALLLTFLFSFDDVVLSRLLSSPETTTLPLAVLSIISRRPSPEVDAIGTVVMAIGLVIFLAAAFIGRRGLVDALGGQGDSR